MGFSVNDGTLRALVPTLCCIEYWTPQENIDSQLHLRSIIAQFLWVFREPPNNGGGALRSAPVCSQT